MELLVEGCIFGLESFPMESVVLWLLSNRGNKVILFGDIVGLLDLLSRPFRGSPLKDVNLEPRRPRWKISSYIVGKVHVDGLRKCLDNLLHWHTDSY